MGLWMIQCVRRESARPDGSLPTWGELVSAASDAHERGFRSTVDAEDERFLSPDSMVAEVRAACADAGQPAPATTGEVVCTVYDSLAADYARTVRQMQELTGTTFTSVNVVGGGSANAYLNQATANACGLPVYAGPTEGTALEILKKLKRSIAKKFRYRLGALLMRKLFMEQRAFFDYQNYGGSVLLGAEKTIVKGHGSGNAASVAVCIDQAYRMQTSHLNERIRDSMASIAFSAESPDRKDN